MTNRECPKCGQHNAFVRYNRAFNRLELECVLCKYDWLAAPEDAAPQVAQAVQETGDGK